MEIQGLHQEASLVRHLTPENRPGDGAEIYPVADVPFVSTAISASCRAICIKMVPVGETVVVASNDLTPGQLEVLIRGLCGHPRESQWLEFKTNYADPEGIGEYVSALANAATMVGEPRAFLVWGVEDTTHEIVGTTFDFAAAKVGNENLENWLLRLLDPHPAYSYHRGLVDGKAVAVLEISAAVHRPVKFKQTEYIRAGSYKKKLQELPEHERQLWRSLDSTPFELGIAAQDLDDTRVLELLDFGSYFALMGSPQPRSQAEVLATLQAEKLISRQPSRQWSITNLGALLFARQLQDFGALGRKGARVIRYQGTSRVSTQREQAGGRGYATGFEGLIEYIDNLMPANEVMGKALRTTVPMYPILAVRELVANALIHQDFAATGTGPMFELFDDRFEISNPGTPLVDPKRFVDTPPVSRNEKLAWTMRRAGVCEERGSGWDKVASEIEFHQLPAPVVRLHETHTTVVLFGHKPLNKMTKDDRVRAVYLHACLKFIGHDQITNASVRQRFGIEQQNSATATRYINETIAANLIVPFDASASRKNMRYVPVWASQTEAGSI